MGGAGSSVNTGLWKGEGRLHAPPSEAIAQAQATQMLRLAGLRKKRGRLLHSPQWSRIQFL